MDRNLIYTTTNPVNGKVTSSFSGQLVVLVCNQCGIPFAVPRSFYDHRLEHGGNWKCPNGHSLYFTENDEQKHKRELERERLSTQRASERAARAEQRLATEEKRSAAFKGHLTRQKKRSTAGVCPCCNRTFKQLASHMKNKHPGYGKISR